MCKSFAFLEPMKTIPFKNWQKSDSFHFVRQQHTDTVSEICFAFSENGSRQTAHDHNHTHLHAHIVDFELKNTFHTSLKIENHARQEKAKRKTRKNRRQKFHNFNRASIDKMSIFQSSSSLLTIEMRAIVILHAREKKEEKKKRRPIQRAHIARHQSTIDISPVLLFSPNNYCFAQKVFFSFAISLLLFSRSTDGRLLNGIDCIVFHLCNVSSSLVCFCLLYFLKFMIRQWIRRETE